MWLERKEQWKVGQRGREGHITEGLRGSAKDLSFYFERKEKPWGVLSRRLKYPDFSDCFVENRL